MRVFWAIPWIILSFIWALPDLQAQPIVSVDPLTHYHTQPADVPVNLERGPQLLIDNYLIASSFGLSKVTHQPHKVESNPIVGWEQGVWQPYLTVLFDEALGKFRMWYDRGLNEICAIAYAESEDGVKWSFPKLGILGDENDLLRISTEYMTGYDANVIDRGPDYHIPDQRYQLAWWGQEGPFDDADQTAKRMPVQGGTGMNIAFSPDGLHWTKYEANPVLHDWSRFPWYFDDPRRPHGVGDIVDIFWDPIRSRYGAFFKSAALTSDHFSKGAHAVRMYIRRLVLMSYSADLIGWMTPQRVLVPEPLEPGQVEFYGVGGTFARGDLLIGFVRMLRDDLAATPGDETEGVGFTTLVTSRDGLHWDRHGEIFLDRNSADPEAWDHAFAWVGSVVPRDKETYLYYGGYKSGHKSNRDRERQLGLAIMPKDRFVSRSADGETIGELKTTPLYFVRHRNPQLVLNAETAKGGKITVQVSDLQGNAYPGYSFDECVPVEGDSFALPVSWKWVESL